MAQLRGKLVVQRVNFDFAHLSGQGLLLLGAKNVHDLDSLVYRVPGLVHVFHEEAVNIVSDFSCVVSDRELSGTAKLAFLVVWIVL